MDGRHQPGFPEDREWPNQLTLQVDVGAEANGGHRSGKGGVIPAAWAAEHILYTNHGARSQPDMRPVMKGIQVCAAVADGAGG